MEVACSHPFASRSASSCGNKPVTAPAVSHCRDAVAAAEALIIPAAVPVVPTEKLNAPVTSFGKVIVSVGNDALKEAVELATVAPVAVTTRSELGAPAFRRRMAMLVAVVVTSYRARPAESVLL